MSPDGPAATRRVSPRAWRRAVAAAAVVGLLLRLGFAFGYWTGKPLNHDEREYLLLAANLASGHGFTYDRPGGQPATGERFGRAPGYPFVLAPLLPDPARMAAIVSTPTGSPDAASLAPVRILQAVIGAVTIWLLASVARRAAGPGAGLAAAWLTAVHPTLVWMPAYVLSETLFSLLALASVALLDAAVPGAGTATGTPVSGRRAAGLAVGAGLLAGAATLTRPGMILFLALAVPWLAWRRAWRAAVLLIAGTAIVVAPWTIRNTLAYGRVVLVASDGGVTFWTGNNALARGEGDMAANPDIKRANLALRADHPGLTPEELEPIYYREALGWVAAHPADWVRLMLRKAFYTIVPVGPSYRLHSALYYWASVVPYTVLLPLAVAGFLALRRHGRTPVPLLLLAASALLACLVFFPQERFRIPVVDPTLIIGAAAWWALRRDPPSPVLAS